VQQDHANRVVAVRGRSFGTGYLLGPYLILTAADVVAAGPGGDENPQIQFSGRTEWLDCAVVWFRDDAEVDAALMRITSPYWTPPDHLVPVRWGRLTGPDADQAWDAVGFADTDPAVSGLRDTERISGTVNPGSRRGKRYAARIISTASQDLGDSSSAGLSGAAMFCGELLTGVIVVDPAQWTRGRAEAVPAWLLHADHGFRAALNRDLATPTVLESVELDRAGILEVPQPPPAHSPALLLRAEAEIVPFRGRTKILAELRDWCTGKTSSRAVISMRLITGPAGQGKTRIAQELAKHVRSHDWITGQLARGDPPPQAFETFARSQVPLLLVVEYAESRTPPLLAMLDALARRRGAVPVRLLLLARAAGEWWRLLRDSRPWIAEIAVEPAEHPLPPLYPEVADRREAFGTSLRALAAALSRMHAYQGVPWTSIADSIASSDMEGLNVEGPVSALELDMAALATLLQSGPEPVRHGPGSLLEEVLLAHEARYWQSTALTKGLMISDMAQRRAVTVACLAQPSDEPTALAITRLVPGLRDLSEDQLLTAVEWIRTLYPAHEGTFWGALQPDRLAEHLLTDTARTAPGMLNEVLPALPTALLPQVFTFLGRSWASRPELSELVTEIIVAHPEELAPAAVRSIGQVTDPAPLADALNRVIDGRSISTTLLADLLLAVPEHTDLLARPALNLAYTFARSVAAALPNNRIAALPAFASVLNQLTFRLYQVGESEGQGKGRIDGLLKFSQLSLDTARALVEEQGDQHLSHLAMALHIHALLLKEAGRVDEALDFADQSILLWRRLADEHGTRVGSLAAINTRAIILASTGRPADALEAFEEALKLQDVMPEVGWAKKQIQIALKLNRAAQLSKAGRNKEALAAFTTMLSELRRLAREKPDSYVPLLRTALLQYAESLIAAHRWKKAAEILDETIDLLRSAAQRQFPMNATHLAHALQMRGIVAHALHATDTAIELLEEASTLYRDRIPFDPSAARPLADSLSLLGIILSESGDQRKALRETEDAVKVLRDLTASDPGTYSRPLVQELLRLETRLSAVNLLDRAVEILDQVIELLREGSTSTNTENDPELSGALNRRANRRGRLGDTQGALSDIAKAARMRRARARRDPTDETSGELGATLIDQAGLLFQDRPDEALSVADEAVAIFRTLESRHPRRTTKRLAEAMNNRAVFLLRLTRYDEADAELRGAIRLLRPMVTGIQHPAAATLAVLSGNHSRVLSLLGRHQEAIQIAEDALKRYRRLVNHQKPVDPRGFAAASLALGEGLLGTGDQQKALRALAQAFLAAVKAGDEDIARDAYIRLRDLDALPPSVDES
jgi:tetratricopeptide (TPR) repeat protein